MISARVIAITQPVMDTNLPSAEALIAYCARVSNPANQDNPDAKRLLEYCIRNRHWSVFQMANAVLEVEGPRDITRQFTRHESIVVTETEAGELTARADGFDAKAGGIQEFSQRYAAVPHLVDRQMRFQDPKNRQSSIESDDPAISEAEGRASAVKRLAQFQYEAMLEKGIAKETARVVLPEGMTPSRLYCNGTLRSWLHFIDVRSGNGTQLEHVWLAEKIREVIRPHFPKIFGYTA